MESISGISPPPLSDLRNLTTSVSSVGFLLPSSDVEYLGRMSPCLLVPWVQESTECWGPAGVDTGGGSSPMDGINCTAALTGRGEKENFQTRPMRPRRGPKVTTICLQCTLLIFCIPPNLSSMPPFLQRFSGTPL